MFNLVGLLTPEVAEKLSAALSAASRPDTAGEIRLPNQRKAVTIKLMAEDRETVAVTWKLVNARPMKYTGPALNGKGTDLAIEELVLSSERIELELAG